MTRFRSAVRLAALAATAAACIAATPAIAQTEDHAPVGLKSANQMTQDKAGSESWTYAQPRNVFSKYRTVIVDNTAVYSGPDAQFDGISAAERSKFASIITDELRNIAHLLKRLDELLSVIDEREATILRLRYGLGSASMEPMTLKEIGKVVGLTRERVRQIERDVLRRLHRVMDEGQGSEDAA